MMWSEIFRSRGPALLSILHTHLVVVVVVVVVVVLVVLALDSVEYK